MFCFAGTMFIFEFLEDPGLLKDSYVESEMGGISFHQMCYFIMVTISTSACQMLHSDTGASDKTFFLAFWLTRARPVGYGDFSPKTLLGRTFLLFVIVGGVAFFSFETSELLSLRKLENSGLGAFRPGRPGEAHLLVVGGAVAAGGATLADFLAEVCHTSRDDGTVPRVVILSSSDPSKALHRLLTRRFARRHVSLLVGSPLLPKDLARAAASQADFCAVLADLAAADPSAEDEETVLAAAAGAQRAALSSRSAMFRNASLKTPSRATTLFSHAFHPSPQCTGCTRRCRCACC